MKQGLRHISGARDTWRERSGKTGSEGRGPGKELSKDVASAREALPLDPTGALETGLYLR